MAVRNFWLKANIDGRSTELTGGPQRKDGGFYLTVKQRDDGGIIEPIQVEGYATEEDGEIILNLKVWLEGKEVGHFTTKR